MTPTAAPGGTFIHLGDLCGVRTDRSVICWNIRPPDRSSPTGGIFTHTSDLCGVTIEGAVECWGTGQYGRANDPTEVPAGDYAQVSAGDAHTCGLLIDGDVRCWGRGYGDGPEPSAGSFCQVAVGYSHPCGITVGGTIECWDREYIGLTLPYDGWRDPKPGPLPRGGHTQLSSGSVQGYDFACAVAVDRSLRCWSFDGIEKAPDGTFTSVAVGHDAACGLRTDKTLHCWNPENLGEAVATTPGGKFPSVEVAFRYACGRRIDGSLECWAMGERVADPPAGAYGVRVDGALECWTTRVQESPFGRVDPPEGTFVEVSVNDNYGCALGSDSRAVCWGRGSIGRDDPPDVGFSQISVGGSYTCGVRDSGELACWGDIAVSAPVGSFSQVSLGAEHGCALGADGSLTCWTWRAGGHPGADLAPQTGRYTQVSVRGVASCALDSDGAPVCWGEFVIDLYFEALRTWHVPVTQLDSGSESLCRLNSNGRMTCGVGFSPYWASPLIDERGISAIAVGDRHACGLRDDGTLACWGRSRTTSDVPAGEFSQVDATRSTTCALRVDGEPVCWGPGAVSTIEAPAGEFVAVAAAGERGHPCGIRIDGTIECWGPAAAGDVPDWTESLIDASVGAQVACAIRADASVACWVPGTGEEFTGLEGNFAQLASSEFGLPYCGVRTDGSLACSGLGIPGAGL